MRIDELDEFQGLTVDMVRQWLTKHGWEVRECGNGSTDAKKRFTDRVSVLGCDWDSCLGWLLTRVAAAERMSVQTLLREINPRMRKGMPSEAARDAHDGFWLAIPDFACMGAHAPIVVTFDGDGFGIWHPEGFAFPNSKPKTAHFWHFWPCDKNGNKVRWPTDGEGKML